MGSDRERLREIALWFDGAKGMEGTARDLRAIAARLGEGEASSSAPPPPRGVPEEDVRTLMDGAALDAHRMGQAFARAGASAVPTEEIENVLGMVTRRLDAAARAGVEGKT